MAAQHAHADRMESAQPHAVGRAADQAGDPVEHLARRLVGEGHGEDLRRPGATGDQLVGDAGGEHTRLAGACAGQHEQRAALVSHGKALFRVQPLEMGGRRNGVPCRHFGNGLGIVGDFERVGGRRHGTTYSNRRPQRLSLQEDAEDFAWPEV